MSPKPNNSAIANVFDQWAKSGRASRMAEGHQFAAKHAFALLDIQPNDSFLDIGCGLGYAVHWAALIDPSIDAVGVDISKTMIEEARRLATGVENATFDDAGFPDGVKSRYFDHIFSVEALYYSTDLERTLGEVYAHLKPGGHFVTVIDHYLENTDSHHWHTTVGVPLILWSIEDWLQALCSTGLEQVGSEQLKHPQNDQEASWQQHVGSLILWGRKPS